MASGATRSRPRPGSAWPPRDARMGHGHWDYVVDTQGLLKSALVARLASGAVFGLDAASARERFGLALLRREALRAARAACGRAQSPSRGPGVRIHAARRSAIRPRPARVAAPVGAERSLRRDAARGEPRAEALARGALGRPGTKTRGAGKRDRVSRRHRCGTRDRGATRLARFPGAIAAPAMGLGRGGGPARTRERRGRRRHGPYASRRRAGRSDGGDLLRDESGTHRTAWRRPRGERRRRGRRAVGGRGGRGAWHRAAPRNDALHLRARVVSSLCPSSSRGWRGAIAGSRDTWTTWASASEATGRGATGPTSGSTRCRVGETRAAAPLVEALRVRYPSHHILVTHMTPTGRAASRDTFGDSVERAWLPYDVGFAVRGFLAHYQPEFGVLLETEIWPRLLAGRRKARASRSSSRTGACRGDRRCATLACRRSRDGRCRTCAGSRPRPKTMRVDSRGWADGHPRSSAT